MKLLTSLFIIFSFNLFATGVDFTLQDGAINGSSIDQMGASNGDVLMWNGSSWAVSKIGSSGTTLLGTWDATGTLASDTNTISDGCTTAGEYYIISVAGTTLIDGTNVWGIGDWLMCNGTQWVKISGYKLNDLQDVDTETAAPVTGNVLFYNGSQWVPTGELSITAGSTVTVVNDFKLDALAGSGTRCLKVDNAGKVFAVSCATAATGVSDASGASVSTSGSGSVAIAAASNQTITHTVGGTTVMEISSEGVDFKSHVLTGVATPTANNHAATKSYVDDLVMSARDDMGNHTASQDLDMNGNNITNLGLINGVNLNSISANTTAIATNAALIGGHNISLTSPTTGNVIKYDGSKWVVGQDIFGDSAGVTWMNAGAEQIHPSRLGTISLSITANSNAVGTQVASISANLTAINNNASAINTNATRIAGRAATQTAPTAGHSLTWNGSEWVTQDLAVQYSTLTVSGKSVEANDPRLPTQAFPTQSGNNGKFLKTDGSNYAWDDVTGSIQAGVTNIEVAGNSCSTVGQLAKNASGELMVCEDTVALVDEPCTGMNIGAVSFNSEGKMVICSE